MSAIGSTSSGDLDSRDLKKLLVDFGARLSLEDIATAYCAANRDVAAASALLTGIGGCKSEKESLGTRVTPLEQQSALHRSNSVPLEYSTEGIIKKSFLEAKTAREPRLKKSSVSVGTVSGVIGKEYCRARLVANEPREAAKPPKIELKEMPTAETWDEEVHDNTRANGDRMRADMEEFIYKMLREGFQVDMATIREVLAQSGYDVQKSVETLLGSLDMTTGKSGDTVSTGLECEPILDQRQREEASQRDGAGTVTTEWTVSPERSRDRVGQQKDILEALFSVPQIQTTSKKVNRVKEPRGSTAFLPPVTKTFELPKLETRVIVSKEEDQTKDEDDGSEYETLRKAMTEHWVTVKEYCKAAAEAFQQGDWERANKLIEKGDFLKQKAREAGDKSTEKLIEDKSGEETVNLDLQEHEPKEALRLLRRQLTTFSGILTIKYLKIKVGINNEDAKGPRKRLIMKQLRKESIDWTEEANGLTIIIRVDKIDPKCLSFAK